MIRPVTSSKVVMIEDQREQPAEPNAAPVRRYRLARVRFDGRSLDQASRFEHLKRVYD